MSCTRRNLYNLVFRLKTQNTINYLNVWFKTVVSFQAKSCLSLWITMIPSQPRYDRCCRLGSSISLVTTKRNRIQPSPGQSCHKAPLKLSEVCYKVKNYQALTVNPQPQEIPSDVVLHVEVFACFFAADDIGCGCDVDREGDHGWTPANWGQETLRTHQSCHHCKQRNIRYLPSHSES